MNRLDLRSIPATSPTSAETMRLCNLRAGLSNAAGSSTFILGNPKGWLGTAYHEVLEKITVGTLQHESIDAAIDRLWKQAVEAQYERSTGHTLDRRFGKPETWPGYHLARASVLLRARELVAGTTTLTSAPHRTDASSDLSIRERKFTAFGGKLVGRPDVIRPSEIVDYKSGTINEFDEIAQTEVIKIAYLRQLRIYGYLVKETLGWWPQRGILLPLAGPGAEVGLDPTDCIREATEAVSLLDRYNAHLQSGASPDEMASPSPAVCKWCPFKLICPPFWKAASHAWSGKLDGAAVEGVLDEPPRAIHVGAAFAVSLQVHVGSEPSRREQVAPLNPNVHPILSSLVPGDRVRLTGLRVRPDGALVPTSRTVLARVSDLPILGLASR